METHDTYAEGHAQGESRRPRVSTSDLVYNSIVEHREFGKSATRHSIAQMTNLPVSIVDDRVKYLRSVDKVRLAGGNVAGVYEPVDDPMEDRAVSTTMLSNGKVKLELGEHVIEMTRREAMHAGGLLAGLALQFRG